MLVFAVGDSEIISGMAEDYQSNDIKSSAVSQYAAMKPCDQSSIEEMRQGL